MAEQEIVLHNGAVYNDASDGNDIVVDQIVFDEQEAAVGGAASKLVVLHRHRGI